ncbi:MAG TPA: hypothetical protein VI670_17000 [Thermoanaerobaculia bacterium]|jgi:hypothetical protein
MAFQNPTQIVFPSYEHRVQSPWLYLQSAGSTGVDGSLRGAHVRWSLARNLGDTHFPKGDAAATTINFNRPDDYVTVYRAPYNEPQWIAMRFIDPPVAVYDSLATWTYRDVSTGTLILVHFRDGAKYTFVRTTRDPRTAPLAFVIDYCPALIEIEVPDKLFFAANIDVERTPATVMRAEALSVEANEPLSPLFVSCRKSFNNANWCAPDRPPVRRRAVVSTGTPVAPVASVTRFDAIATPCAGPNLFTNGGFEEIAGAPLFAFETDYMQGGSGAGILNVVEDASSVNGAWTGRPHSGRSFLAVDGAGNAGAEVVRQRLTVQSHVIYCFSGWLSTLWPQDVSIPLEFRLAVGSSVQTFRQNTPASVGVWEPFQFFWDSGTADSVIVSIASMSALQIGNDFALDDLSFCDSGRRDCAARIRSENIRSIRFDVQNGFPRTVMLETYDESITRRQWQVLGRFALTTDDAAAARRLDPHSGLIDGHWPKFNDQARLRIANYTDRWQRAGGVKEGVQRYISASNTDPMAMADLPGDQPQDSSIKVSMLEALQLVSLDFHVARVLGVGTIDEDIAADTDAFLYLAEYDTAGVLDDSPTARRVRHFYLGIPTAPVDFREPFPPHLQPVTYGLTVENGETQPPVITDAEGYTPDGVARYVNLFVDPEADDDPLGPFFVPPDEFTAVDHTSSIFYGIEYRGQGEANWRRPEIAHDRHYSDFSGDPETLPLPNNAGDSRPLLRHEERENGVHEYGAYGINWFSRASAVGNVVATNATSIKKAALLLPPANFAVQRIEPESPRILTTAAEQSMLATLTGGQTLVRVTFDYYHVHDINYGFADAVELFFRTEMPRNVAGAVKSVTDDPIDARKAIIRTKPYFINSQGTTITPALNPALFANFTSGVLSCQQENYIIESVAASTVAGEGPIFTIRKNVKGNASDPGGVGAYVTINDYVAPRLPTAVDVMFLAVENMAEAESWGTPNPLATRVKLLPNFTPHTESYVKDGQTVALTLRGLSETATVSVTTPGQYKIQFTSLLPHHPQSGDTDPVDWYKGIVRVPRAADPAGPRKVLDVEVIEHLGDGQPLVLHALDDDPSDPAQLGSVPANYYPGYRLYLHGLDAAAIDAAPGEGTRKTWLGARSADTTGPYWSAVGIPTPIVSVELVSPQLPFKPTGPEYATRPDAYYKSSYTFTLDFAHKPFAVVMYRSNDDAILRALYGDATYTAVTQQLKLLGEDDPNRADRWHELLGFTYPNGTFTTFGTYAFPNPDKGGALNGSQPATIIPAIRDAIRAAFTALTEQPLIYDFIKPPSYVPLPKRPTLRDSQGALLSPTDPDFDPAPMAKRTRNGLEIQFTDFTLDGTGNNIFFYLAREIGNRGRLGEPSPIAGPVLLINSRPPDAPAVKKLYVQEQNDVGSKPAVHFEVNAYPEEQRVLRMQVYRTSDAADALSVRSMKLVKTIDHEATGQVGNLSIHLLDDFEDGVVPFGDPLYYRIVALRKVKTETGVEWAPSQPSKLLLTTMIDTVNPDPPELTFTADAPSGTPPVLTNVALSWPSNVYNGTHFLDMMTSAGTWRTIYTVPSNGTVNVSLATTDLQTGTLAKGDEDGNTIYTRFRVRVLNSSGLFNLTDRVLTI